MDPSGQTASTSDRSSATANDALKRGWSARVSWCVVVSAALHAVVFTASPSWRARVPDLAGLYPETPLTITPIGVAGGGARGGAIRTAEPDPETPVAEMGTGSPGDVDGPTLPSLQESWARIAEGGGLTPTVVVPEEETPSAREREASTDPADSPEAAPDVGGTAELSTTSEAEALAFERLATMRPELALPDLSLWVLLRNPREVDDFMRMTYQRGELDARQSGLVSVVLWIDEQGTVGWADIDQSSGRAEMDEVALELFREVVRFKPARDEHGPVSRSAIFWIGFPWIRLGDRSTAGGLR